MIKLLVGSRISCGSRFWYWGYTDKDGNEFLEKKALEAGQCTNCGSDFKPGEDVLLGCSGDQVLCSRCVILQRIPQIITAYEQCREKLEKLIEVLKDAGVADQVSDIIGEVE